MIVLLNSVLFAGVAEIGHDLAARYQEGEFLNLHTVVAAESIQGTTQTLPLEKIRHLFSSFKQHGSQHVVVAYTFDSPQILKQLRGFLSQYDNEIYAFRLRFSTAVVTKLLQTLDNPDKASKAYSQWLKNQETGSHSGDMGYEIIVYSLDLTETVTAIWDDLHEPIELVEYRENWPEMFRREQEALSKKLQGMIVDVEHIGSTAIPQMPAKPVIDMLITVEYLRDAPKCIQPLRELGYAFIDYPQNTNRLFFRKGKPRSHHLHIVEKGSAAESDHIHFRDALLSDPILKGEYLQLKRDAIRKHRYRRALYGERKTELIQQALKKFDPRS